MLSSYKALGTSSVIATNSVIFLMRSEVSRLVKM